MPIFITFSSFFLPASSFIVPRFAQKQTKKEEALFSTEKVAVNDVRSAGDVNDGAGDEIRVVLA